MAKLEPKPYILWFDKIRIEDVPLVGRENASLEEMYRHLTKQHVRILPGFAITCHAYRYVLEQKDAFDRLRVCVNHPSEGNLSNH